MTDRVNALIVTLEKDIREDDADEVMMAIRMLRGVLSVRGNVSDIGSHVAEIRARGLIEKRLWETLYERGEE